MIRDRPRGTCFLLALESFCEKPQETTNHFIVYDGGGVHGYWPLY